MCTWRRNLRNKIQELAKITAMDLLCLASPDTCKNLLNVMIAIIMYNILKNTLVSNYNPLRNMPYRGIRIEAQFI